MNCPICKAKMEDAFGDYGYECKECGCIVCQECKHAMRSLDQAEKYDTRTGADYRCSECGTDVYSVDLYPE